MRWSLIRILTLTVEQEHHPNQPCQAGLHGIYLRAFCTGLDSMLQPYRQALLDLEQEVRTNSYIQTIIHKSCTWQLQHPTLSRKYRF